MAVEIPVEKWRGRISEVVLGATENDSGEKRKSVRIGGQSALPFLDCDGEIPNRPVIAAEVHDAPPDIPAVIKDDFSGILDSPVLWAKKAVSEWGADVICLKLSGTNPEGLNRSASDSEKLVSELIKTVSAPLIVYGCGSEEKDATVLRAVGDALSPERGAIGLAENEKYKAIARVAVDTGQNIIAFSNLDINLAKQLNIMLTDCGVEKDRIVMDPLMGALGYGLEYSYSVIERIRLAALQGDSMLQMPIICDATVAWNAREATDESSSGSKLQGINWEALTGISALTAGADIVIMKHPESIKIANRMVKTTGSVTERN